MTAKAREAEKLLTQEQKEEILRVTDQRGIILLCNQIPGEIKIREAHRKFFCKNAHMTAAKYLSDLPQDYQEGIMDYVLRRYSFGDIYFKYKHEFFLNCVVRFFSKTRVNLNNFIDEMFLFLSDESTVILLEEAEKLTTDTKVLKRMKKVRDRYSISEPILEEE